MKLHSVLLGWRGDPYTAYTPDANAQTTGNATPSSTPAAQCFEVN